MIDFGLPRFKIPIPALGTIKPLCRYPQGGFAFQAKPIKETPVLYDEDAYLDAEEFYAKCDFNPLVIPDPEDETVLMFFDLMGIA